MNFEGAGLFSTWGMISGDLPIEELVSRSSAAGVSWVAAQFDDGDNLGNLPELRQLLHAHAISFGLWDAAPDPYRLQRAVGFGPDFWIAQSEGNPVDWRNLVGGIPHTMQRGVVTNFSGLDDACLTSAGFCCLPECYLPENPNASPEGMIEEAKRRGYKTVVPCLGVYWDTALAAYSSQPDFAIWAAETMTEADWNELGRRCSSGGGDVPDNDEPDWWEKAYKGGPMVKVKGFPRPLYPPDANKYGKKPSVDGPDVEAYKRTVSRAGRWPWQSFDDSYSNGFAHGTSGNVGETGVAGVQRQQDIDDTGWLGEKTFNTLRSIRCPQGPHEGEMAMDAYSADLINKAWERFGGHEPAPDDGKTLRKKALDKAISQLGIKESPPNSNQVKYCTWYGLLGPWCAMFVTWCFETAGDSPSFLQGGRYSYVPYIVADARNGKYGLKTTDDPQPGDLVAYDWGFDGTYDHVGIFEKWLNSTQWNAIEGNTSTSNDSNGGEVMRRTRTKGAQATVFVRVAEP
jgi:hypothetical protein